MTKLDLSTQSNIQLELLLAKEENMIKGITNILKEIDKVCLEEIDMTLEQLLEAHDWSIDRLKALQLEIKDRQQPLVI
jgi:hypothetical protein